MRKKNLFEFLKINLFLFLFLISFSGRSFTGLTILNIRIGEVIVGALFIFSLFLIFYKNLEYKNLLNLFKLLVLVFLFSFIFFNELVFTDYVIKSSSYIWISSLIFISLVLSKFLSENSWFYIFYMLLPFILFYTETINYPNFLESFYLSYSDKFDYLKGSDLALVIISAQIISIIKLKRNYYIYVYFILIYSIYLPFLLYKSKGAFLGTSIFFIFILFSNIRYIFGNLKNILTLIIGVGIFFLSVNHVSQLNLYGEDSVVNYVEKTSSNLNSIVDSKNSRTIFSSLFIKDGRLYSTEGNANWRLEIWQDVFFNLQDKKLLWTGYGYTSIIPEMEVEYRQGTDGSNENVHNFIINILARGGIVSLTIYMLFLLYLANLSKKRSNNNLLIFYILSIFTISFFDASNESVRYPFIFYTFLGIFFNNINETYRFKLSN